MTFEIYFMCAAAWALLFLFISWTSGDDIDVAYFLLVFGTSLIWPLMSVATVLYFIDKNKELVLIKGRKK